jgi:hypothetical protein
VPCGLNLPILASCKKLKKDFKNVGFILLSSKGVAKKMKSET